MNSRIIAYPIFILASFMAMFLIGLLGSILFSDIPDIDLSSIFFVSGSIIIGVLFSEWILLKAPNEEVVKI